MSATKIVLLGDLRFPKLDDDVKAKDGYIGKIEMVDLFCEGKE